MAHGSDSDIQIRRFKALYCKLEVNSDRDLFEDNFGVMNNKTGQVLTKIWNLLILINIIDNEKHII